MLAPRDKLWSTPETALEAMMRMTRVSSSDVVYDVGCGDGRMLIRAAQEGAQAVGIEIDAKRARSARRKVDACGEELAGRVRVQCRNAMNLTPEEAVENGMSVVLLYLIPRGYKAILPLLQGIAAARRKNGATEPLRVGTYITGLPEV